MDFSAFSSIFANLPDLPPDAAEYRDRIKAAEDEAAHAPLPDPAGLPPMPGMGDPGMGAPALGGFAVGTKVRDKLSGQTGAVVDSPGGAGLDYGDVVFVKLDTDGATHPVLKEFLEPVPTAAPVSPMAPGPLGTPAPAPAALPKAAGALPGKEGELAPGSPIPPKPSSTNAALHRRLMNARLSHPVKVQASAKPAPVVAVPAATQVRVPVTAAADHSDPVITRPSDARRLTYSSMVAKLKALPTPSHADALSQVGYVPTNWDLLVARLMTDGIILRSAKGSFDVAQMVKAGFTEAEIRYSLGCKGVPMYALDTAFKALKIDGSAKGASFTSLGIAAYRRLYNLGAEFTDADVVSEMKQFSKKDLPAAWIKAIAPTEPMPTDDPGEGMTWAADETTGKWYKTTKAA